MVALPDPLTRQKGRVAAHSHGPCRERRPSVDTCLAGTGAAISLLRSTAGAGPALATTQGVPRTAGRRRPRPCPVLNWMVARRPGASSPRAPGGLVSHPASASGQGPPSSSSMARRVRLSCLHGPVPPDAESSRLGLFSSTRESRLPDRSRSCARDAGAACAWPLRVAPGGGLPGSQVLALCPCLRQVTGGGTVTSAALCGIGMRSDPDIAFRYADTRGRKERDGW